MDEISIRAVPADRQEEESGCPGQRKDGEEQPLDSLSQQDPGAADGDVLVGENHLGERLAQKVALGLADGHGRGPRGHTKGVGHRLHDSVDGAALLRATGEEHPAHDGGVPVHVLRKEVGHQISQALLQGGELSRELDDGEAGLYPPFLIHALPGSLLEDLTQLVEMTTEHLDPFIDSGQERQGEAPDLAALLVAQVAECLHESGHQVALGDQEVHRQHHIQAPHHLVDAFAQGLSQGGYLVAVALQIHHAYRNQDSVHRLSGPALAKQAEEREPFLKVIFLCGPASGRVQDDGVVAQPPVAVAGPTHTPHASALGVWKWHARVSQRRGLASP